MKANSTTTIVTYCLLSLAGTASFVIPEPLVMPEVATAPTIPDLATLDDFERVCPESPAEVDGFVEVGDLNALIVDWDDLPAK